MGLHFSRCSFPDAGMRLRRASKAKRDFKGFVFLFFFYVESGGLKVTAKETSDIFLSV